MFYQNAQPHSSNSRMPFESNLRFGVTLAQFLHEWFEAMAQMADLTRRACDLFVENGGASTTQAKPPSPRNASEQQSGSVDMEKLKQSLQSMDPMQAAQVMHAVQVMQTMEMMQRGQNARANGPQPTAW
jgi:hypothetical protein